MSNIIADALTFCVYVGSSNGRLVGTLLSGETDLTSVFTSANTSRIYSIDPSTKAVRTFSPGNPFSQIQVLTPLGNYAIKGVIDFDFADILPSIDSTKNAALVTAIRSVLYPPTPSPNPSPNSPNPAPTPAPVTYNTTLTGTGQDNTVSAAQVSLNALAGDTFSFNSLSSATGLPASMNVYVGSVSPANQVALASFDSGYVGRRFRYVVKAGNHSSIATDTTFGGTGLTFVDGDRVLV